jgi:transcriptional regulator with XRE-family HTH domain
MKKHFSQQKMARLLFMKEQHYRDIETGACRWIDVATCLRIAYILDMDVRELAIEIVEGCK